MVDNEGARRDRRALKALLSSAGYRSKRIGESGYEVTFGGKYRDWDVRIGSSNGWLTFSIYFFATPPVGSIRSALYERILELNDLFVAAKFTKAKEMLTLDLQYRFEHTDAEVLQNQIGLLISLCEEHYPELFRVIAGDEALKTLEDAFVRTSITKGAE